MSIQESSEVENPKPSAWMRKWAFDGVKPYKEKNENGRMVWPNKFKWLPVTIAKIFEDDVPLFAPISNKD